MFGLGKIKKTQQKGVTLNADGTISEADATKKELGLQTLNQRLRHIDKLTAYTTTLTPKYDKDGNPTYDKEGNPIVTATKQETSASFIYRNTNQATLGMGQIGKRYPIVSKNQKAYKMLVLKVAHFEEKYGAEHPLTNVAAKLLWSAAGDLATRSIYPRDADVSVARMTSGNDWHNKEEHLNG